MSPYRLELQLLLALIVFFRVYPFSAGQLSTSSTTFHSHLDRLQDKILQRISYRPLSSHQRQSSLNPAQIRRTYLHLFTAFYLSKLFIANCHASPPSPQPLTPVGNSKSAASPSAALAAALAAMASNWAAKRVRKRQPVLEGLEASPPRVV